MKKIAAPGRRGSVKRTAFKADDDIVGEIDHMSIASEQAKKAQETNAEDIRQQQQAAEAEAARQLEEAAFRQKQETEAEVARQAAEEEAARRIQEAELHQKEQAEAEAARQAAAVEATKQREAALAARHAAEAEAARQQEIAAEAEAAAALAHQQRLAAEEEAARQQQQAAEAEAAAAAAAALREKQEAEAVAEAARQRELDAEEEFRKRQEAAAEESRRHQEAAAKEEAIRLQREAEAEALRREKEEAEAEARRVVEEAEAAEKRAQEEEDAREQAERREREAAVQAEKERVAAEAAAALKEKVEKDRRDAEAAKSKREAFLNDMDSFSDGFAQKQADKDASLQRTIGAENDMISSSLSQASQSYKAPPPIVRPASPPTNPSPVPLALEEPPDVDLSAPPAFYNKEEVVVAKSSSAAISSSSNPETSDTFNVLTSALFASEDSVPASKDGLFGPSSDLSSNSAPKDSALFGASTVQPDDDDVLRMPTRAVNVRKQKKETAHSVQSSASEVRAAQSAPAPEASAPAPTSDERKESSSIFDRVKGGLKGLTSPKPSSGDFSDDEEDDEDDDDDLDTPMTDSEKREWRAKQEDLTVKRKDFHGAVAYAFKGIFAWQMYSAVDAIDEYGKPYTEYLMRCQWGTRWDNMQPWLVARRFREFDALNDMLLKHFPRSQEKMFPLPKKMLFGSLDSETIDQRTKDIETYMATIITDIPSMLKSRYINDFFGISDRIKTITKQIEEMAAKMPAQDAGEEEQLFTGVVPLAPGTTEEMGLGDEKEAEIAAAKKAESKAAPIKTLGLDDLLSMEQVEAMCTVNMIPFDSDDLGQMEEYVRDLRNLLRKTRTKDITRDPRIRRALETCNKGWPRLHCTCMIDPDGGSGGVMLIPRAMQTEEELDMAVKELRSFLMAQQMGSPLHF